MLSEKEFQNAPDQEATVSGSPTLHQEEMPYPEEGTQKCLMEKENTEVSDEFNRNVQETEDEGKKKSSASSLIAMVLVSVMVALAGRGAQGNVQTTEVSSAVEESVAVGSSLQNTIVSELTDKIVEELYSEEEADSEENSAVMDLPEETNGHGTGKEEWQPFEPVDYALRENGIMVITVYNDDFDFDTMSDRILYQETMDESTFSGLTLPEPVEVNGYEAAGMMLVYGDYSVWSEQTGYNRGDPSFSLALGDVLTVEDIKKIPICKEDGIRYINIHVAWKSLHTEEAEQIFCDDGQGNVIGYSMDSPLYSSGIIYTSLFEKPVREGYEFIGWYDENGKEVTFIFGEDLYKDLFDEEGNYLGGETIEVHLTAGWKKIEN